MKKADRQQYIREMIAVGVFVITLCAICIYMNKTGYVPISMV